MKNELLKQAAEAAKSVKDRLEEKANTLASGGMTIETCWMKNHDPEDFMKLMKLAEENGGGIPFSKMGEVNKILGKYSETPVPETFMNRFTKVN